MAEGLSKSEESNSKKIDLNSALECAICLQPCVHPAELPCGHIFCFLCIKGIAFQSGRCAMCRDPIPLDFLFKPRLVTPLQLENSEDKCNWYYEGYSGWWQYDQRASAEIEDAFQKGEKSCQLLLAGYLYTIDFTSMLQYRQTNPVRRRRIKRDKATTDKLGVAGLRPGLDAETAAAGDSNAVQAAEALLRTMGEVEMGLQRLWQQTSDELDHLQRQTGEPDTLLRTNFQTGQSYTPVERRLHLRMLDPEHQGLESLGPDECPSEFAFRTISPNPRDGRTFNPRLELGDGGDDDDDDSQDSGEEEPNPAPTTMFSGPCTVSSVAFRPMPLRAHAQERSEQDLESTSKN